jgi:hypothetical protein
VGAFGNLIIFIVALPFIAVCLNTLFYWLGLGGFLSEEFMVFLHPALITLSFVATAFGAWRVRQFIRRNDSAHRDEALLQELEDRKDKGV